MPNVRSDSPWNRQPSRPTAIPIANGPVNSPPVDPRTPRASLYVSTPTTAPAKAPITLCDRVGVEDMRVFSEPDSQAPTAAPPARLAV